MINTEAFTTRCNTNILCDLLLDIMHREADKYKDDDHLYACLYTFIRQFRDEDKIVITSETLKSKIHKGMEQIHSLGDPMQEWFVRGCLDLWVDGLAENSKEKFDE